MSTTDEIAQMIEDVENRSSKLNDWETGFIDDITVKFGRGKGLSPNEDAKLTEIWDRVTS